MLGGLIVLSVFLIAMLAPWITGYDPLDMDIRHRLQTPTWEHKLGTDNFGRDLWARIAYGARISLIISVISVGLSSFIGTFVGLCAGYFGGLFDLIVMRIVDIVLGFPVIILALALVAALGPGPINVAIALVFVFRARS